jgi:hypothetical protein
MLLKELRVLKFLSQDSKPRISLDTTRNYVLCGIRLIMFWRNTPPVTLGLK